MTTNSALRATLRSLSLGRLRAGASALAICAGVSFTGSPAWGEPREKIVFTSTTITDPVPHGEIYVVDYPDGTNPIRLTNDGFADSQPMLSPDGKGRIVFDSNRTAGSLSANDGDLFLIRYKADGTANPPLLPTSLTRGSSAAFHPSGRHIVFHRSAFGTPINPYGTRIRGRNDPGGPRIDSDIFMVNLDDLLENAEVPTNLTNGLFKLDPDGSLRPPMSGERGDFASDDADWSPDGKWIAFTSRIPIPGNVPQTDQVLFHGIYVMNLSTRQVTRLTASGIEERSPAWSPDGTRISFMRRRTDNLTFEIWVLRVRIDPETQTITVEPGSETQLTNNFIPDLSHGWAPPGPDRGEQIVFQRDVGAPDLNQIFVMDANPDTLDERQLTGSATPTGAVLGQNLFPKWGRIEVRQDPQ